jgi:hypothetical protein
MESAELALRVGYHEFAPNVWGALARKRAYRAALNSAFSFIPALTATCTERFHCLNPLFTTRMVWSPFLKCSVVEWLK